jgi:hypothetical protein
MRKITDLPVTSPPYEIENCFSVNNLNKPNMSRMNLGDVFNWIKEESIKNGLTVVMKDDKIMFIKG